MTLYLKWTSTGRVPSYQGGAPIPVGEWTPTVADPILCERGWHACRWDDAVHHISDELWICELADPVITGNDKVVSSSLRLVEQVTAIDERTLRHFAADCAERVLPLSAWAAAWAAAWDAAGDAAGAAARAAARAAACAAAWAAAWADERAWQADRLLVHYAGLDPANFARGAR